MGKMTLLAVKMVGHGIITESNDGPIGGWKNSMANSARRLKKWKDVL